MKNINRGVLLSTIILVSSCTVGGEMMDWPYCDLPDYVSSYETITIELVNNSISGNNNDTQIYKYYSESPEVVLAFYNVIEGMHRSPKKTEQNFDKYWQKVSIDFKKENLNYKFEYYELSMKDGYFVFNEDDIYGFKGNFYGVALSVIGENSDKLTRL